MDPVGNGGDECLPRKDLLSLRLREAVRDQMSGTLLREIDDMWQDEGFALPAAPSEPVGGQRVTRFQGYLNQVDWTDTGHVRKAIRVFETAPHHLFVPPESPDWDPSDTIRRLNKLFFRDGYALDDKGRITRSRPPVLGDSHLHNLREPSAILEHLERIDSGLDRDDPSQVIGSAKELIESTANSFSRNARPPIRRTTTCPPSEQGRVRVAHPPESSGFGTRQHQAGPADSGRSSDRVDWRRRTP